MVQPQWITENLAFDGIILGNGSFPVHSLALSILDSHNQILCCDGAVDRLVLYSETSDSANGGGRPLPSAVVGDLDSISEESRIRFADRLHLVADQSTNDLAKAFAFAAQSGLRRLAVMGVFGGREDHSLGNFAVLQDFSSQFDLQVYTDTGRFVSVNGDRELESFRGQQISLFTSHADVQISCESLKWPLRAQRLPQLWRGTLNESLGTSFHVRSENGPALVFQSYE